MLDALRSAVGPASEIIDDTPLTRSLYSTDASIYRIEPLAVAHPRSRDELISVVRACLDLKIPVTARGAGTSCAGNAVGPGLVIDVSRHLRAIHHIDPVAQTAEIDPGVVQDQLQQALKPHGLRLGPDPSTSSRCTVGGMIGNNACGPRALSYGRMADNVVELEVITGTGEVLRLGHDDIPELRQLVLANLGTIRLEFGRLFRQVSGYALEHLLPENKFNLPRFFAGTEGTLGLITRAIVRLIPDPAVRTMVALGYPSMAQAGDDIANLLRFEPTACEGLDSRIVNVVRTRKGEAAVGTLPAGQGWMFIELTGTDPAEVRSRAQALLDEACAVEGWIVESEQRASELWQLRADGAGLAGVSLEAPAYAGWEDAAVPPDKLGQYLREFEQLLTQHGMKALPYGHFGDGCVHARIDFPLTEPDGAQRYRAFMVDAAKLVGRHRGSLSGEHGDGRARSELLPHMYSPDAIKLFRAVKHIFDPKGLLNPGVLVDPDPTAANIRMVAATRSPLNISDPDFVQQVHQCSGVGKCLANSTANGAVMCPSFQATRQEKDSTRGRARALQEMVNGSLITDGWSSPEVAQALDLCLSCKGCARDCPTGIDMAAYKARVTHERYKGKLRPRKHYALGWLPRWGQLITSLPGAARIVNTVGRLPVLRNVLLWGAGVDQRREIPRFAPARVRRRTRPPEITGTKGPVLVWVDSFSDCFESDSFAATVQVLANLGYQPQLLDKTACCGLTWISTGQLDGARRQLARAAAQLAPYVQAGIPIVGIEPSCTAVWRSDAPELLPDDADVAVLNGTVLTLAEFLARDPDFVAPDLRGHTIVVQPHCHHASIIGWQHDQQLLDATGATVVRVGGCCGLAGNFGVERGHHEVSVAVFEHDLAPAMREAGEDAIVLADGFSCRTQLASLAGRSSMSLAELLAAHRSQ